MVHLLWACVLYCGYEMCLCSQSAHTEVSRAALSSHIILQSVSWTARVTANVTHTHGAVSATLSGWRTSSGSSLEMQKATVVRLEYCSHQVHHVIRQHLFKSFSTQLQLFYVSQTLFSEWSVLYVTIASFMIVVAIATLIWGMVCCCRRWAQILHHLILTKILLSVNTHAVLNLRETLGIFFLLQSLRNWLIYGVCFFFFFFFKITLKAQKQSAQK